MTLRTRHDSKLRISIAACALAGGFLLAACGGGSSDDEDGAPASGGGDANTEQAEGQEGNPAANTSDDASATVVLDGTTYEFRSNPDATLQTRTYCSTENNALQGTLRLVDESGAFIDGGKLDFGFHGPDFDIAGVDEVIEVTLPSGAGGDGPVSYQAGGDTIETDLSGTSATATFTAEGDSGDVSGTIEVSC